jgi:hypothetical protein
VRAARLAVRLPQVLDELRNGTLHLTALFLLAPHLTDDNAEATTRAIAVAVMPSAAVRSRPIGTFCASRLACALALVGAWQPPKAHESPKMVSTLAAHVALHASASGRVLQAVRHCSSLQKLMPRSGPSVGAGSPGGVSVVNSSTNGPPSAGPSNALRPKPLSPSLRNRVTR